MDSIDVGIVKMLQQDGRTQYNEIAERLNLANATVHARIIKLIRNKVIDKFSVQINPDTIGKPLSFLLSISVDHHKDNPKETMAKLLEIRDALAVYCATGDWDYHILFQTKDVNAMKAIVTNEIKEKVPSILRSSTQIILEKIEKPLTLE